MKRFLSILCGVLISCIAIAQCTTCTINITGNDPGNYSVSIGQVLCVAWRQPDWQGVHHIGRPALQSGPYQFGQYLCASGGAFDNYGVARVDTFYIADPSAVFNNYDSMTNNLLGIAREATIRNAGTMIAGSYWDTAGTFINEGSFTIATDIYIGNSSQFINHGKLSVGRDFANGPTSHFTTSCIVDVRRNWYNAGSISGPLSGCGGFDITGTSYNSGIVGDTGHIDLCDAGHPASGIDGSTAGTMTGVTFCQCTDTCSDAPTGLSTLLTASAFSIFPNPASDRIQIRFAQATQATTISLINLMGEKLQTEILPQGSREATVNTASLSSGLYILSVESRGARISRKIEIIK